MKLVIVRHADAGDSEEFAKTGQPDALRPLSDKGRQQMKDAVPGLVRLVPKCDLIVSSPYTRAIQTANAVAGRYEAPVLETATLEPETAPDDFIHWLREAEDAEIVIAVGHEPHLGILVTWLMTGASDSHVDIKKAAACCLDFDGQIRRGAGILRWLMGPRELAALA
jgi:phosphohistidine phosphatase